MELDYSKRLYPVTMLSVAGINELLDRSGLPEVQELRQAIFSKVLPSIYTTGQYKDDGSVQNSIGGQLFNQIQNNVPPISPYQRPGESNARFLTRKNRNELNNFKFPKKTLDYVFLSNTLDVALFGHTAQSLKVMLRVDSIRDFMIPPALHLILGCESHIMSLYQMNQDEEQIVHYLRYIEMMSNFSTKAYQNRFLVPVMSFLGEDVWYPFTIGVNMVNYVSSYITIDQYLAATKGIFVKEKPIDKSFMIPGVTK